MHDVIGGVRPYIDIRKSRCLIQIILICLKKINWRFSENKSLLNVKKPIYPVMYLPKVDFQMDASRESDRWQLSLDVLLWPALIYWSTMLCLRVSPGYDFKADGESLTTAQYKVTVSCIAPPARSICQSSPAPCLPPQRASSTAPSRTWYAKILKTV